MVKWEILFEMLRKGCHTSEATYYRPKVCFLYMDSGYMYIYIIYTYIYYIYIYIYICVCVCVCLCMCVCVCVYVYIYMNNICVCVCLRVCVFYISMQIHSITKMKPKSTVKMLTRDSDVSHI